MLQALCSRVLHVPDKENLSNSRLSKNWTLHRNTEFSIFGKWSHHEPMRGFYKLQPWLWSQSQNWTEGIVTGSRRQRVLKIYKLALGAQSSFTTTAVLDLKAEFLVDQHAALAPCCELFPFGRHRLSCLCTNSSAWGCRWEIFQKNLHFHKWVLKIFNMDRLCAHVFRFVANFMHVLSTCTVSCRTFPTFTLCIEMKFHWVRICSFNCSWTDLSFQI